MRMIARMACVAAGAVMLGGCQSFPLTSWMFKGGRAADGQDRQLAGNPTGALEDGKASLRDGNISAAVASFRIALLDPAARAEACNGLAVSYARLGRDDLAQRYFLAAMSAEPENQKYVANLLRLQRQQQLQLMARTDMPAPAVTASARSAPLAVQQSGRLASGLTERVSRGEVRIRVRPDLGNAPAMAVGERETRTVESSPSRVAVLAVNPVTPAATSTGK